VFFKPFKIGKFGGIFSMSLKLNKIERLRSKTFCSQKPAYFNKIAGFFSFKTLNGVVWQFFRIERFSSWFLYSFHYEDT